MNILFLGYDQSETSLIDFLIHEGSTVSHTKDSLSDNNLQQADFIISFGYRHLIKQSQLQLCRRPIVNLHISFLPYNRGAHPVFWALMEKTPLGVSIHEIDSGIDTGPILTQELAEGIDETMSFRMVHHRLLRQIEELFVQNWPNIRDQSIKPQKQAHKGSYHNVADLPPFTGGWDTAISEVRRQLQT